MGGVRGADHIICVKHVGPLCARDYKGVGNEYVQEGKLVIECVRK